MSAPPVPQKNSTVGSGKGGGGDGGGGAGGNGGAGGSGAATMHEQ